MRALRTSGGVAGVALVIGVLAAVRLLAVFDWDPTVFTAFGEEAAATTEYGEEKLERAVLTRPHQGHDGKFFFVQSNDPWLLDPDSHAAVLDRPVYRSQRMFYPLIAGGLGVFPPGVIVWALPVVNIIMLAVGTWAVARIAEKHGLPTWVGVAFALNFGLLSELFIDGAGIVAFSLACIGALALEENRMVVAGAAFTGSALTREVMAIFVGFVALMWLIRRKAVPWIISVPAAVAIGVWAFYVRLRIDLPPGADQVREITLVPFSGVVDAVTSGHANTADYLVIVVFLTLIAVVPLRAWRSDVYLTWGAAGFAVLGPFLTIFVWQKSFDISRALAPLFTAFVIEFFMARKRHRDAQSLEQRTGVRPAT